MTNATKSVTVIDVAAETVTFAKVVGVDAPIALLVLRAEGAEPVIITRPVDIAKVPMTIDLIQALGAEFATRLVATGLNDGLGGLRPEIELEYISDAFPLIPGLVKADAGSSTRTDVQPKPTLH